MPECLVGENTPCLTTAVDACLPGGDALFALLAAGLGLLTAYVELRTHFRHVSMWVLITSPATYLYFGLNFGLAGLAYVLLAQWKSPKEVTDITACVFGAGFGAMAVLRARVVTLKSGDEEIAIGPAYILDQFMALLRRQLDLRLALRRTPLVRRHMTGIDFFRASEYALKMVRGARQLVGDKEVKDFDRNVEELRRTAKEDLGGTTKEEMCPEDLSRNRWLVQVNSYDLGFLLLGVVHEKWLAREFGGKNGERFLWPEEQSKADRREANLPRICRLRRWLWLWGGRIKSSCLEDAKRILLPRCLRRWCRDHVPDGLKKHCPTCDEDRRTLSPEERPPLVRKKCADSTIEGVLQYVEGMQAQPPEGIELAEIETLLAEIEERPTTDDKAQDLTNIGLLVGNRLGWSFFRDHFNPPKA